VRDWKNDSAMIRKHGYRAFGDHAFSDLIADICEAQAARAEGEGGQMSKTPEKKDWIVTVRCVIVKSVTVEDCTEEEAREHPFAEHCTGEQEIEMPDWEVTKVEEAK
jgi:hypothetical protein